jgi:hypothetical protein
MTLRPWIRGATPAPGTGVANAAVTNVARM